VLHNVIGCCEPKSEQIRRETIQRAASSRMFLFLRQTRPFSRKKSNTPRKTGQVKLASLYCDYYDNEPHKPSEIITEKLAAGILKLAENRVEHFTKNVRPMFDHVLEIDPEKVVRLQDEILGTSDTQVDS
jgi:hypothetical protein